MNKPVAGFVEGKKEESKKKKICLKFVGKSHILINKSSVEVGSNSCMLCS